MITLALALLLQADDLDGKLAELARRAEEVGKLADEIAALGPAALDAVRRRAAASEGEARDRLLAVAREIERRERLKDFAAPATRVTLSAREAPLSEIVADLARRTRTPIRIGSAPRNDPVTIELADVPLLEALDRLCRAHGRLALRWPRVPSAGDDTITLDRGDPSAVPRSLHGAFGIELASITLTRVRDFGGAPAADMRLQLQAFWERGTKPLTARIRLTELVDDRGRSYVDAVEPPPPFEGPWRNVPQQFVLVSSRLPTADATALRTVAGTLEVVLASDVEILRIERPERARDVTVRGESMWFTLVDFARGPRGFTARVETAVDTPLRARDLRVYDGSGRSWPFTVTGSARDAETNTIAVSLAFAAPADAEAAELRLTTPKPGPALTIPWRFENVRLR